MQGTQSATKGKDEEKERREDKDKGKPHCKRLKVDQEASATESAPATMAGQPELVAGVLADTTMAGQPELVVSRPKCVSVMY